MAVVARHIRADTGVDRRDATARDRRVGMPADEITLHTERECDQADHGGADGGRERWTPDRHRLTRSIERQNSRHDVTLHHPDRWILRLTVCAKAYPKHSPRS